jgi:hypothetical protein
LISKSCFFRRDEKVVRMIQIFFLRQLTIQISNFQSHHEVINNKKNNVIKLEKFNVIVILRNKL